MMKLTEEQLVALAGFIGLDKEEVELFAGKPGDKGPWVKGFGYRVKKDAYVTTNNFGSWLLGNDGQAALMDTIESDNKFNVIRNEPHFEEATQEWLRCVSIYRVDDEDKPDGVGFAKTRQEALIKAALDYRKGAGLSHEHV